MIEDEGSQSQQDDAQDLLQNSNDDYTTQHEEELMIADMKKNYQELFLDGMYNVLLLHFLILH